MQKTGNVIKIIIYSSTSAELLVAKSRFVLAGNDLSEVAILIFLANKVSTNIGHYNEGDRVVAAELESSEWTTTLASIAPARIPSVLPQSRENAAAIKNLNPSSPIHGVPVA